MTGWLGKPHREQDQIRGQGWSGPLRPPGRSLDRPGNRPAREMTVAALAAAQNPAYRPACELLPFHPAQSRSAPIPVSLQLRCPPGRPTLTAPPGRGRDQLLRPRYVPPKRQARHRPARSGPAGGARAWVGPAGDFIMTVRCKV